MATLTAQILVGDSHQFHGGIHPRHALYLSENDRPAWILLRHDPLDVGASERLATWIPSVDHMLEDGLILFAAHGLRAPEVVHELGGSGDHDEPLVLPQHFSEGQLVKLRGATVRASHGGEKMILTVLPESTIGTQLSVLDSYAWEYVVCQPSTV